MAENKVALIDARQESSINYTSIDKKEAYFKNGKTEIQGSEELIQNLVTRDWFFRLLRPIIVCLMACLIFWMSGDKIIPLLSLLAGIFGNNSS